MVCPLNSMKWNIRHWQLKPYLGDDKNIMRVMPWLLLAIFFSCYPISDKFSCHIETNTLICRTKKLTGFCVMRTWVVNRFQRVKKNIETKYKSWFEESVSWWSLFFVNFKLFLGKHGFHHPTKMGESNFVFRGTCIFNDFSRGKQVGGTFCFSRKVGRWWVINRIPLPGMIHSVLKSFSFSYSCL